jgi:hypothetical protein
MYKILLAAFNKIRCHLFTSKIKNKIREANVRKADTLALVPLLPVLRSCADKNSPEYIVSLTSYGKRLTDTAPYAIVSLLGQNVKPDKIILWVAHEDKENIAGILYGLVEKGLEIRFCEDIRQYKKLIPALREFPDECIITADDDVYYPADWFEQLMTEHKKDPRKIVCHRANGIKVDNNHKLLPYRKWDPVIDPSVYFAPQSGGCHQPECIFPTGVGGILYPPKCFYKDILNRELFTELAPYADDIWFWAMAVLNGEYFEKAPYAVIENNCSMLNKLRDVECRQMQREKPLYYYNVRGKGNDWQLEAVLNTYPQIIEYLRRIQPATYKNKK